MLRKPKIHFVGGTVRSVKKTKSRNIVSLSSSASKLSSPPKPVDHGPIPASGSRTGSPRDVLPEREIEFAELRDGSLAEMIEHPANPAKSLLAVYSNGKVHYTDRLRVGSEVLVPFSRTAFLSRHVSLPQGAEPYGELVSLLADVGVLFHSCLSIDLAAQLLMIAYVFDSWFPEKLPVAPYLALLGPPGSGKTTAMRILSLLCRRSLLTSDISSAGFYEVSHRLGPTLLIDETATAGHPRTLLHLLRSSSSRGFVSLRKDKAQMAYGPKVLAWIELPNDAALNSRCVIIPMHRTSRTDLMRPDDSSVLQFAEKVRMRLLQFRFEHYRWLSISKVPADVNLSSRALDLYRALALPFQENPDICEELARSIAGQRQFQPSFLSATKASAVRVLYIGVHAFPSTAVYKISYLTTLINQDLASRGEPSTLNEHKVGRILTSLGLTKRARMGTGIFVVLERSDLVRIHEIARDYEVEDTDPNQNCDICKRAGTVLRTSTAEAADEKQVRSDESKRENSEGREHGPVAETRAAKRRATPSTQSRDREVKK